ncbi:MAG: ABC transporter ATP-binding protein [Pseudoflavonifractor sp.]
MSDVIVKNISKSFGDQQVINDISFIVKDGHFLSLLGPSGCGKTTLLRIVAGLEYADTGSILVGEHDITAVPVEKRNIGIVFQNYALIPHMTVFNNIAYGLKVRKRSKDEIAKKVQEYISLVGLDGMQDRKVTKLSGGQQQRVALARALIIEPSILLLDEPLSALDRKIRAEMQYEIRRIQKQVGITTLFVTHDQEEAMTMSDEILLMKDGKIEQLSTPEDMYNNPVSLYASDFLGKANTINGILETADDALLIRGNGWAFSTVARPGIHIGDAVCAAIRGEHFKISTASVPGCCPAKIKHMVFTGAICRLTVALGADEVIVSCINMDAGALCVGQTIFLTVAPEMVHYFSR